MAITDGIVIHPGEPSLAGTRAVCGQGVRAGEGLTARVGGRRLRFRADGCLSLFVAEPDRYLSNTAPTRCTRTDESPPSEWAFE